MATNYTAYHNGVSDGQQAVRDRPAETTHETVNGWFAPGQVLPDEALINALGSRQLGDVLGLTGPQIEERGDAWDGALKSYNEGFRDGAHSAVE